MGKAPTASVGHVPKTELALHGGGGFNAKAPWLGAAGLNQNEKGGWKRPETCQNTLSTYYYL